MRTALNRLSVILLAAIIVLSGCNGGRKARELDRATALAILNESVPPGAPDWTVHIPSTIMVPTKGASADYQAEVARDMEFYAKLQEVGWIKEEPQCNLPGIGEGYEPVLHCFAAASPDASLSKDQRRGTSNETNLGIVATRTSYGSVTGIRQQGTDAVVEVEKVANPTTLFQNFFPTLISLSGNSVPGYWPKQVTTTKTTEEFRFERYDDGWRLRK